MKITVELCLGFDSLHSKVTYKRCLIFTVLPFFVHSKTMQTVQNNYAVFFIPGVLFMSEMLV